MTTHIRFRDAQLAPIWEKVQKGERLSLEDGRTLYATPDFLSLGKMAHHVQRERSGDAVYFVINQKIEHTNVCVLSCKFCDFAAKKGDEKAYEMTTDDVLAKLNPDIKEVHITGGMPPDWEWERYLDIVRSIKEQFPDTDVKAFTAVEIDYFSKKFKKSIEQVLKELYAVGLRTMPGGGAEIFSERVRKELFHQKIGGDGWLKVHKTAHRLGIPTNSTMLYGHIETIDERLVHMMKLREAQDETGGFLTFIPLAFQPGDTGIKAKNDFTSAIDDLKTIAISRLMLDNFPHIKAYWVMLTEEVASVALKFGADDLEGTVGGEKIAHDAGAISPMALAKDQLIRIIKAAGKIPVERDVYYNPLKIHGEKIIAKIPYLNSAPFYGALDQGQFKLMPLVPKRIGNLWERSPIDAAPFSLMDYLERRNELELLDFCISTGREAKSVLLFSREPIQNGGDLPIGITNDTATSIRLLDVLLTHRWSRKADFIRLHAGVNNYSAYGAVLLIGDEALRVKEQGLPEFPYVYDLGKEWYDWQGLPFVFAVWAVRAGLPEATRLDLSKRIGDALEHAKVRGNFQLHGKRLGLSAAQTSEYVQGFEYHLGTEQQTAIQLFSTLVSKRYDTVDTENIGQSPRW